jgi:hypothetical protein
MTDDRRRVQTPLRCGRHRAHAGLRALRQYSSRAAHKVVWRRPPIPILGQHSYPPPLPCEGSIRQGDWAGSIRPRFYPAIRSLALARANDPAIHEEDQDRYRDALRWIGGQRAAAFWIDIRDETVSRILKLALKESGLEMRGTGPSRRRRG